MAMRGVTDRVTHAMCRTTREEAEQDMRRAQECASRREMVEYCLAPRSQGDVATLQGGGVSAEGRTKEAHALQGSGVPQPAAEGRTKDADALQGSGVPQPAVTKRRRDVDASQGRDVSKHATTKMALSRQTGALRAENGVARKSAARFPAKPKDNDDQKVLLLQLKRPHYDAIKNRQKLWEARPLVDGEARGWQPSIFNKLAQVGRTVVLQSGAGTNDRVRVAEVRRYTAGTVAGSSAVQDMVVDLGADLLPDAAGARERAKVYTDLYGHRRCADGFVAMRLEWPREASTAASDENRPKCTDAKGCGRVFCEACYPSG